MIENLVMPGAGGLALGFAGGYACKKVIKWLMIAVGLIIMALGGLEYYHLIRVDWVKVQSAAINGTQWGYRHMTAIQHHIASESAAVGVVGFAAGFAGGFLKG